MVNVSEHSREDLQYEPFPSDEERAGAFAGMTKLLQQHFPWGEWAGWYSGHLIPGEAVAGWAQFTEDDSGRRVLSGLLLLADDAITADLLRKVPVAALENSISLTNRQAREQLGEELKALPKLERVPGMAPEDFSGVVAAHYRAWAKAVPNPAAAMAAEASVKPPTMHTWIREARLRGLLPPAKRRKGRRDVS